MDITLCLMACRSLVNKKGPSLTTAPIHIHAYAAFPPRSNLGLIMLPAHDGTAKMLSRNSCLVGLSLRYVLALGCLDASSEPQWKVDNTRSFTGTGLNQVA